MNQVPALGYMPQLDGLRGVAILIVMTAHFGLGDILPSEQYVSACRGLGVSIFFVLSGFLIMETLLKQRNKIDNFFSFGNEILIFLTGKALRIYPAYFLVVFTLATIDFQNFSDTAHWHYIFAANMDFARYQDILSSYALSHAPTAHLWSISVQEQLYLLLPFTVFFLRGKILVTTICIGLLLAPVWRFYWVFIDNTSTTYQHLFALPSLLDTLLAGAFLSLYRRNYCGLKNIITSLSKWIIPISIFLTLFIIGLKGAHFASRYTTVVYDCFLSVSICYLIFRASNNTSDLAGKLFNTSIFRFLGKISFGLYLYHALAPHIAGFVLSYFGATAERTSLLWVLNYILMSSLIAWVSWNYFEKPILRVRGKAIKSWRLKLDSRAVQDNPRANI